MSDSMNEYPIETIPDTEWWSENFAIAFCDAKSGATVFHSTGRWHSAPDLWREFTMVHVPGHPPLFYRGYGRGDSDKGPSSGVSRYTITTPETSARLQFSGPVWVQAGSEHFNLQEPPQELLEIDIQFEGVTPLWDMKGSSAEAATQIGSLHTEQIGVGTGSISFREHVFEVKQAYAIRDHSRGVRDMTHFGAHTWMNGRFEGGRSFHLYAANMQGQEKSAPGMSNAVIVENDTFYPATVTGLNLPTSTNVRDSAAHVRLESALGAMDISVTEVIDSFPYYMVMPFDTTVEPVTSQPAATMIDQAVRLEWDGQTGLGWSERGYADVPLALKTGTIL